MPSLLDALALFRRQLAVQDARTATQLAAAYRRAFRALGDDIAAITEAMRILPADQRRNRLFYQQQLDRLRFQVLVQMQRFGVTAAGLTDTEARAAIELALRHSTQLPLLALPEAYRAQIAASFFRLNTDAVETMLAFVGDASPLNTALSQRLGPVMAERVGQRLTDAIARGIGPNEVARLIRNETGQALVWATTTARTAQLWAYREATRTNYVANSHVVEGWVWHASLDDRCCLSCIAMHGTEHSVSETLNDHHRGRCAMLPLVKGGREPQRPTGEAWFRQLSEREQQERMGPAMYAAWRRGQFRFGDLSQPRQDPVYGVMLHEASLKGLLGGRAQEYYRKAA